MRDFSESLCLHDEQRISKAYLKTRSGPRLTPTRLQMALVMVMLPAPFKYLLLYWNLGIEREAENVQDLGEISASLHIEVTLLHILLSPSIKQLGESL